MVSQIQSFGNDIHLYPLYLKWAAQSFNQGNLQEGMSFFNLASRRVQIWEHKVYRQMWELRGCPDGDPEYGKKAFHSLDGLSSTALQKAQAISLAIHRTLSGYRQEWDMREAQIHRYLWISHRMPKHDAEYGRHAFYSTHGQSSTLQDRYNAVQRYAEQSKVLTCLTDGKEVQLIKREDGKLEYIVIDGTSVTGEFVPHNNKSINEYIISLRQCLVTVNENNIPNFEPLFFCEEYPAPINSPSTEIQLFRTGDQLIWRIFDKETKKVSWDYADDATTRMIEHVKKLPFREQKACRKEYCVEEIFDSDTNSWFITVSRIQTQSQFNASKKIDKDHWAITLINGGPSTDLFGLRDQLLGHAQIIIEGIKEGQSFVTIVQLLSAGKAIDSSKGIGKVAIAKYAELKVTYKKSSPTWIREKSDVEKLLYQAEIDEHEGCSFHLIGHSGYNCLTWSIDRIGLAGIELPPSENKIPSAYVEWIAHNPSFVTFKTN